MVDCEKGASFFIVPVSITTLIGLKSVPQFLQVFSFLGKCRPNGHKVPLGSLLVNFLCHVLRLFVPFSCL